MELNRKVVVEVMLLISCMLIAGVAFYYLYFVLHPVDRPTNATNTVLNLTPEEHCKNVAFGNDCCVQCRTNGYKFGGYEECNATDCNLSVVCRCVIDNKTMELYSTQNGRVNRS
jgi:hypothetical protein